MEQDTKAQGMGEFRAQCGQIRGFMLSSVNCKPKGKNGEIGQINATGGNV